MNFICSNFFWEFIEIPLVSSFLIGSTSEEVDKCVSFWKNRLINEDFSEDDFRDWIEKEYPAYDVKIDSFKIAKYPITNADYKSFCLELDYQLSPSLLEGYPPDHPVWGVTVEDVQAFINFLFNQTGIVFRLPTELEWEYAARGLSRFEYPYGDSFDFGAANTIESGIHSTTPVYKYDQFPSPFGVVDMAGNVEEWVSDYYQPYPGGRLVVDHLIEALGYKYQILRGGFFAGGGDLSRCARRHGPFPSPEYRYTGFRLVCSH